VLCAVAKGDESRSVEGAAVRVRDIADCQLSIADYYLSRHVKLAIGNWKSAMTQGTWHFDPDYTTVEFSIRNLWFKVRGRFRDLEGQIVLDESDISRSSVTATIEVDSIDTGNKRRNAHLLAADFFDVEKFPEIEFRSTSVRRGKDRDSLDLEGELTIKNKTVPIALAVNEMDRSRSPRGDEFVYYSATADIDRCAFGINYGRGFIGRRLRVNINVQASNTSQKGRRK
jgi:polyisoprenoid-binding protein YceI